ncbi:MAG TPA: response regulator transcription factor [Bacteroidetes bacterium]|nr:response regulator transcription factor [Bacteroidota bacterium]
MKKITSIIVDDEQDSRETLRNYVGKYCPQVSLLSECANIQEAKVAILKYAPQLVFLDIEMPHGNAFDLLEQWGEIDFQIIFITAYSQYAVQAFNLSAAHYILKPVDIEELEKAVATVEQLIFKKEKLSRANILLENMAALNSQNRKLVLPLMEGFEVVKMSEILYCEAQDNFTCFYFLNGKKSLICRSLKFYETALSELGFCRIHRSHIVNLEYVKRYVKGKGGSVILENGKEILVSNNKKKELLRRIVGNG